MSSITSSDESSNWEIEKRCINLAFAVGGPVLLYGLIFNFAGYMITGAVLYSSSLIATAIRDSASDPCSEV